MKSTAAPLAPGVALVTILLCAALLAACNAPAAMATPVAAAPSPTHTTVATATRTATPTATATHTATPAPTATPTETATATATPTATATETPTSTPTHTPSPTPSLTPTLIQPLPPTSTPTPVYAPPTPTPPIERRTQVVLVMSAESDMAGASATFDAVRRRGIRTLSFVSLRAHPDFVRLSIADGHLPGLFLDAGDDPVADIAAWEALLERVLSAVPYRLAMAEDESSASALEGLGYTVVRAEAQVSGTAGQVVRLPLGAGGAHQLASLAQAAAGAGLEIGPHEIAERANAQPYVRPLRATTLQEFKDRYLIVLDPGHTRADNGTPIYPPVGRPVLERWAVLERAYAWEELLRAEGWTTVRTHDDDSLFDEYTRTPDTVPDGEHTRRDDLQYRANLCHYLGVRSGRIPVVVSMHVDSNANPAKRGPLTFYAAHGAPELLADGKQLAEEMHNELARFWVDQEIDAPGRGVLHSDTFAWDRAAEAGYTLIGNRFTLPAPGAAVLPTEVYIGVLIEAGMATHPEEAQVLATVEGNVLLAQVHHRAFLNWVQWMLDHRNDDV